MPRPVIFDPKGAVALQSLAFNFKVSLSTTQVTSLGTDPGSGTRTVTRTCSGTASKTITRGDIPFRSDDGYWEFPEGKFAVWRVWPPFIFTLDGHTPDFHGDSIVPAQAHAFPNALTWFGNGGGFRSSDISGAYFPPSAMDARVALTFASDLSIHEAITYSDPADGTNSEADSPLGTVTIGMSRRLTRIESRIEYTDDVPHDAPEDISWSAYCAGAGPDVVTDWRNLAGQTIPAGDISATKTESETLPEGTTGTSDWTLAVHAA